MNSPDKRTFGKPALSANRLARGCSRVAIVAAVFAVFLGMDYELDAASFDEHANPMGFYIAGAAAVAIYVLGRAIRYFGAA